MTPLPDPSKPFAQQDGIVLLACCVWGESRSCTNLARLGVGCVVRNRSARQSTEFGKTFPEVILHPGAFSCFNKGNVNYPKLLTPLAHETQATWDGCYHIAQEVYNGIATDPTRNAIFYFSEPIKEPPKVWGPVAATLSVSGLQFFRRLELTEELGESAFDNLA